MSEPVVTPGADDIGRELLTAREAWQRAWATYHRWLAVYTEYTGYGPAAREAHLARLREGGDAEG